MWPEASPKLLIIWVRQKIYFYCYFLLILFFYLSFALSCSVFLPFNASWSVVLICLFVSFFLLLFGCTKDLGYLKLMNYITLHYITLHYTTLYYTWIHYTTLHYITLHYNLPRIVASQQLMTSKMRECAVCAQAVSKLWFGLLSSLFWLAVLWFLSSISLLNASIFSVALGSRLEVGIMKVKAI